MVFGPRPEKVVDSGEKSKGEGEENWKGGAPAGGKGGERNK